MKTSTPILIILLIIFFTCPASAKVKNDFPHYNIDLKVDPVKGVLDVSGEYYFDGNKINIDTLVFYLDCKLSIISFLVNGQHVDLSLAGDSDIRFMPSAKRYVIPLNQINREARHLKIDFAYKGGLSELPDGWPNRLEASWSEFGLYYPWFPIFNNDTRLFTFSVKVETLDEYKAFGLGQVEQKDGYFYISSKIPTSDIVICLSEEIKTHISSIGNNELRIFHKNFSDSLTNMMSQDISNIIQHFNNWFGEINMDLSLVESQRKTGGGYARIGGVVLAGIEEDAYFSNRGGYARYFGHEFAHLWWYKADSNTWEDWLNESFAEYSALMFLRKHYGMDTFEKRLQLKKKNLNGTPPIWNFDRQHSEYPVVNEVLYNKGPVLLYELEEKIGQDAFLNFCRELVNNDIHTTVGFFAILKSNHGEEVSDFFMELLTNR